MKAPACVVLFLKGQEFAALFKTPFLQVCSYIFVHCDQHIHMELQKKSMWQLS